MVRRGKVCNLSQAVREVAEYTGSVWTPVVAIRREDAERLGYNDAELAATGVRLRA